MITRGSLQSPRLLGAIKSAVVEAVTRSHAQICPSVAVWIKNRRGEPSMYVQVSRGYPARFYDTEGRNITDTVCGALRDWHADRRRVLGGRVRRVQA